MIEAARDTIFALSSGRLPAAIAVVRLSGPHAGAALQALIGRQAEPRRATLAKVRDPQTQEIIDEALALWFPGPNSETGEDIAELQLHGGRAVVAAVFAVLERIDGLRPAEAGEFTRRAFENGRMDLAQVEGLADLLAADTEAQRRQAIRHVGGMLGQQVEAWRTALIQALALVEAQIDFPDEGDVVGDHLGPALKIAETVAQEIATALSDDRRGERLRDGLVVVIAGPPNVGKSSLLNWLAGRDAAIVSPIAGTTRDFVEVHLDLKGCSVTVIDTAGLRDGSIDPIELEGMRRTRQRAEAADLILWVTDVTAEDCVPMTHTSYTWSVKNKIDKLDYCYLHESDSSSDFGISVRQSMGLDGLLDALGRFASDCLLAHGTSLIARARQRAALADCHGALEDTDCPAEEEIVAERLRLACRELGRVSGRVDVEDVLDVVFRDFCIGK